MAQSGVCAGVPYRCRQRSPENSVPIRYRPSTTAHRRLSKVATRRYAGFMSEPASINARIVEALYIEALVLSDAARGGFDELRETANDRGPALRAVRSGSASNCRVRPEDVEVTCEALRTTTRVMHCLAWLLNHRAWFAGQISAGQLRRHGRLISHFPASDPTVVGRLPDDLAELVHQSERLYARILRLETAWRNDRPAPPSAIDRLRDRLLARA